MSNQRSNTTSHDGQQLASIPIEGNDYQLCLKTGALDLVTRANRKPNQLTQRDRKELGFSTMLRSPNTARKSRLQGQGTTCL
ncbi:hypothetical protein RRF57_010949 [Xylaria bambusicola]|uniref:Uncharacterized protein n=1 Tax=Xylaria bambusicola TaxID=326684 RepID=A0AAN7Z974_9PEZI